MLTPLRPVRRYLPLTPHVRCFRGCKAHALFQTACGAHWCIACYKRYRLTELTQVFYLQDAWWIDQEQRTQSALWRCVEWIRDASEEEIETACQFFGVAR